MRKLTIFYFIYWHDKRFLKQIGGPMKVFDLCDNLRDLGHNVFLFTPSIGFPEKQTKARVVPIPLIELPVVRFLSYQVMATLASLFLIVKGRVQKYFS